MTNKTYFQMFILNVNELSKEDGIYGKLVIIQFVKQRQIPYYIRKI